MENGSLTSIHKNRLSRFAFLAKSQVTIQNHFLSTNLRLKYLEVIIIYVLILDTNLKSKNTLKIKLISAIKSSLILPRTCLLFIQKCPNTELFLVRIFLYSDWIQKNTDQKHLRIWILFTQCFARPHLDYADIIYD